MPNLYDYKKEDYAALLASTVLDASKGELFDAAGLKPDTTNRTILIGVGGTGVRTIDYVKGAIAKRLDASWKRYIGFMGVDASWTEYDGASYLDKSEQVVITKDDVETRMASPATYPAAVRSFVPKGAKLSNLSADGAGRTRLQGKVKIHDAPAGGMGVDQDIVHRLSTLANSLDQLTDDHGKYQIYVIGSVCGGTCSGSFLEMPSLLRRAFSDPKRLSINAMLYLPDTLAKLDPANESQLYANGYAALKELNYYMGMFMRPEYEETWSYNDPAARELTHSSTVTEEGFIHIPYLVGTPSGPNKDASDTAKETIAEFLISTLAKLSSADGGMFLTSAFDSNARSAAKIGQKLTDPGNPHKEAAGEYHEFPKRFAAIGFAEAAAPQRLVRAYTVGRVCTMAGIKPVSAQERASTPANGIVPFRGEDDLMSATEGTTRSEELLAPIAKILPIVHSGDFNFGRDLQEQDITWKRIRDSYYDNEAIKLKTNNIIKNNTSSKEMDALKDKIKNAYVEFRKNVQAFVREEGPYAFVNLYNGRFTLVDGKPGLGLSEMLKNLVDGNNPNGTAYTRWMSEESARTALTQIRKHISETNINILGVETGTHKAQAAQWVEAYNNWGKAQINDVRRKTALGPNGALHEYFQMPAAKLAQEVEAFGRLLESMTGIYQNHGSKMETYEEFRNAQDNKTAVNLAAVNTHSYTWLKEQADAALADANARKMRDTLVDDFFGYDDKNQANSDKWLEIPKKLITVNPVTKKLALTVPDMAIPARQLFDKHLAKSFPSTVKVSIETMFSQLAAEGTPYEETAHEVIKQLYSRSKPLFNGTIPAESMFGYIMFPAALQESTEEGPAIAAALKNAAQTVCKNVQVYASDDTDSIVFYQLAAPMEIYRLKDLKLWESHYEEGHYGIKNKASFLHGMSPDVIVESSVTDGTTYSEITGWIDYPAIAPDGKDPRVKDNKGNISREGQILIKLDETVRRARELGVLYSEETPSGWIINRVFCNTVKDSWKFTLTKCRPDKATGLLPLGKALAETVAAQNGKKLDDISRKVYLDKGGLMDSEYPTEELAWEFATRTLRHHMPMAIEIRKTLVLFEEWAKNIEEFNKNIMKRFQPAKMVHMLRGGTLRRSEDGSWVYEGTDGFNQDLLVMDMADFLTGKERYMIENGLLFYYLFTMLDDALDHSEDAFDDAFEYAKDNLRALMKDRDMDALNSGKEQVAAIVAERAALAEKGARLDGDPKAQPKAIFVKNMGEMFDEDELREIDLFYYRVGLWEKL